MLTRRLDGRVLLEEGRGLLGLGNTVGHRYPVFDLLAFWAARIRLGVWILEALKLTADSDCSFSHHSCDPSACEEVCPKQGTYLPTV